MRAMKRRKTFLRAKVTCVDINTVLGMNGNIRAISVSADDG